MVTSLGGSKSCNRNSRRTWENKRKKKSFALGLLLLGPTKGWTIYWISGKHFGFRISITKEQLASCCVLPGVSEEKTWSVGEMLFQCLTDSRTVQSPGNWQRLWGFGVMLKVSALSYDQPSWTFAQPLWHMIFIHCIGSGDHFLSISSPFAGIDKSCKDGSKYWLISLQYLLSSCLSAFCHKI